MSYNLSNSIAAFKEIYKDYPWDLLFSNWSYSNGELSYDKQAFIISPKIERIPKSLILIYK